MEEFRAGYDFSCKNAGAIYAAFEGDKYIADIIKEIEVLTNNLNSMDGFRTDVDKLKGDVAEFWHSGTFNIDAAVKGSTNRTLVDRSHDFASADITSNFLDIFGLKYYKTGAESAKQQAKSVFERYSEYKARGGMDGLEKFLSDRGYTQDTVLSDAIYAGQFRVIPSDQMKNAVAYLEMKIAKERLTRPEEVERYQETLAMLRDKIKDNSGNESIPLSTKEAEELAGLVKEGGFDPIDFGITTEELVKFQYVLQQAFKAGLTAATISIVLKVAPEVIKAIQYLIKCGELDKDQFQKIGFAALTGGTEGFIRGTISAAITTSCKAGLIGEAFKSANPSVIASITVITINTMKNAYLVATRQKNSMELANDLVKEMFISCSALICGNVVQSVMIELPVLGFMIGSFVGSVMGAFAYSTGYNAVLSFCVDTGFTMFGLVEQNYQLPKDVMEAIGINVFEYETFQYPTFTCRKLEYPKLKIRSLEFSPIEIIFMRRGVIGVHQIGYV